MPVRASGTAVKSFLESKAKKNAKTQRKYRNLLKRLQTFAEGTLHKSTVNDLTYPEIISFKNTSQECDSSAGSSAGMAGAASAAPDLKSDPPIHNLLRLRNGLDNGGHFPLTLIFTA
jgi:hypothetical protein